MTPRLIRLEDNTGYWLWEDGIHALSWDSEDHAAFALRREKRAVPRYRLRSIVPVAWRMCLASSGYGDRRALVGYRDKRAIGVTEL